ncbi:MAG: hypothetical protein J1E85_07445 [Ruminococcus sp.]|nr:hypothetical protein [Ruminococcus sp.]
MIKIEENKTRKKLRIAQCVLYLVQIFMCTFPYINGTASDGYFYSYSVLDVLSFLGGKFPDSAEGAAIQQAIPFFFIFLIIPIIGFFFCLFDKYRNLKNIVSMICCLAGVVSILFIVGYLLSIGSLIALLLYIVICFITTMSMFARITSDENTHKK